MATPKKKHLIELMIEAGITWPVGAEYAAQDKLNLWLYFFKMKPSIRPGDEHYSAKLGPIGNPHLLPSLCRNWHQTIVTREQYAEAVAEIKPAEQIDTQQKPQYCASVMRQMPSETIESLLAEIKAKREEHGELVAKVDALVLEITSIEQQVDSKLKGYGFSLYPIASSSETEQPVITDWRDLQVGDVIECTAYNDKRDDPWPGGWATQNIGTQQVVSKINDSNGKISIKDSQDSGYAFKFIRRP